MPDVTFVAGDIMSLDFGEHVFDVAISLEVLSHVADQEGFVRKLAHLLKPGGVLILATQNRPILERNTDIQPLQPGQIRRWVDSGELRRLLTPHFKVKRLRSLTPKGRGGFLRLVNSYKLNALLGAVALGRPTERVKVWLGLGWTLMVLAEKRG
jgi:SAM-dependent methyltransferase